MSPAQSPSANAAISSLAAGLPSDTWQVTPHGRDELAGGMTRLPAAELELLVRLDGRLPLARVQESMRSVSTAAFITAFRGLRAGGFIAPAQHDPFELRFQAALDSLATNDGEAGVDASLVSLRRTGYFVGIARARDPAPPRKAGAPLSAIVVEDEPVLARFVKSYLAFDGIQSRLASNRAEVLAELNRRPLPDVVLLDVTLPDANGFDILRRIRAHPVLKDLAVIMLTGKATREAVLEGIEAGADGYVTKPFEADAMMRAVRTVLGLPEPEAGVPCVDAWSQHDARHRRAVRSF